MTPADLSSYPGSFSAQPLETAVEASDFEAADRSAAHGRLDERLEDSSNVTGRLDHNGPDASIALHESALETEGAELRSHSLSANSRRGYAADWKNFTAWCAAQGREALPASAETLTLYMVDRSATLANASQYDPNDRCHQPSA